MDAFANQKTKPVKLKFGHMWPATSFQHRFFQDWAQKVQEQTGGKVSVTLYPVGTLFPPFETYEALISGIVDVASAADGFLPERFPLNTNLTQCLHGIPSAEVGTRIRWEIWKKFPEVRLEFKDSHVLWVISNPPGNIHTLKPVRTLKDLEGMELRCPPGLVPWIKALGAAPVTMSMNETFIALEKGIVGGVMAENEPLLTFRLAEVTKYTSVINARGGPFFVCMNRNTWKKLPPDVQQVIEGLDDWGRTEMAKRWDAIEQKATEFATREHDHQFLNPSPEVIEEIYTRLTPVYTTWAADMEAKGKPGKAILQELTRLIKDVQ
jgi:TRAP-type C4-dicarboxylate transport system substrate-binding protein